MSMFSGLGINVEKPSRMTLIHPGTKEALCFRDSEQTAWIDLLSLSGPIAKAHERTALDAQIRRGRRSQNVEQFELNMTDRLARITLGWSLCTLEGDPLEVPFSEENAKELYSLPELIWVRDQAVEFASDLGNFQPAASKNS